MDFHSRMLIYMYKKFFMDWVVKLDKKHEGFTSLFIKDENSLFWMVDKFWMDELTGLCGNLWQDGSLMSKSLRC